MKTANVIVNLVQDPGGGRTADDEQDVFTHRTPAVPEMVKRRKEVRARRVHPGTLVKEHDLPSLRLPLQQILKKMKGSKPILWN